MQQLGNRLSTSSALFSMATQTDQIQIVSTGRGIVLDVQATNVDTEGRPNRCHATTKLALDEAVRFETLLAKAVSAAWDADDPLTERTDPRQTALWSPSTYTAPVRRAA